MALFYRICVTYVHSYHVVSKSEIRVGAEWNYLPIIAGCIFFNAHWNSWVSAAEDITLTTKRYNRELDLWLVGLARVNICIYAGVGTTGWIYTFNKNKHQ